MRIAVCGLGRAGRALIHKILTEKKDELCCAVCRDSSEKVGQDIGIFLGMRHLGIPVVPVCAAALELVQRHVDVVIDFSHKSMTLEMARICADHGISMAACTTNFEENELLELKKVAGQSEKGMVYAPNLTIGINLLMEFAGRISRLLPDFDFAIVERHCKDKKKVTTTAKKIADCIDREQVPISAVRAGGYVGVHEVTAANEHERLTIIHESFSRAAFADGALLAAAYIVDRKGYYEMSDVMRELETKMLDGSGE